MTGRHIEITPALKAYAVDKMQRMEKYCPKIIDVNVVLTVEKYRHIAEVTILVGGNKVNSKEATDDMYSAIDKVLEKIERQLHKHKEKISDHTVRTQVPEVVEELTDDEDLDTYSEAKLS
ncbi:MAG: ribosome-associated translation inhibitor RaiA [Candidatus Schekmanbacteria bacterium]|nr:ribosome-associated translation inhibitor RaiA [Candidatus Schekmanbacteria bacterium]